ncbi:hypothetical protein IKX73_02590 [Candidatus Saccharibacteria bacterium]|nr:hypothetical protein [Candidatus Saccharibacteria bacterium]
MKKIETTSIKYLIFQSLAIAIAGIIIWPLLDLFICNVITHTEFVYSVTDHIIEPIVFGCILGIVLWAVERKANSKKEKKNGRK